MERVCIYLRKSRADLEAEQRGDGETLAKHRKMLLKVAEDQNLNIVRMREEIVSGESLIHRPEMLQLLREVESGTYDAVLVMDMDRLGRGDMVDQGTIQRAFKTSKTKIITPRKVYDLEDEWDEEYSEFESFMARKELKIINRRLQRGRIASVREGNYIGNKPPYGYIKKTLSDGGHSLDPDPQQSPVVRMIFEMYTEQGMGTARIARKLNELNIPTANLRQWIVTTISGIIQNPVYIGKIRWNARPVKNGTGTTSKSRPRAAKEDWILVDGKHDPIISEETYSKAQHILKTKYHVPAPAGKISNPLSGLVRCDMCQSAMIMRPYATQQAHLMCSNQLCSNKSARLAYVEDKVLNGLSQWLTDYKAEWGKRKPPKASISGSGIEVKQQAIIQLEKELLELEGQRGKLHDLLERGVYSVDIYLDRSQNLAERIAATQISIEATEQDLQFELCQQKANYEVIPQIEDVLKLYAKTADPAKKNSLLKSVLHSSVYRKEKTQRLDDFTLTLYPKLPRG